jgi:hypothetical protein
MSTGRHQIFRLWRYVWLILSIAVVAPLTFPIEIHAQFVCITNNGSIEIVGYTGQGGALAIPAFINGLPVTSIEAGAFSDNSSLTSISIPDRVTNIGSAAFEDCTFTNIDLGQGLASVGSAAFFSSHLIGVTIPNSVMTIGTNAFANCLYLTNAVINDSPCDIQISAFQFCKNLRNVSAGNQIVSIDDHAFDDCTSLTNFIIPSTVSSIGRYAFEATLLKTVNISTNISSIGDFAFAGCSTLGSIIIPFSVTNIGNFAFSGCVGMGGIIVDTNNSVYSSAGNVLFDKNQTTLIQFPAGKLAFSYSVSNTVRSIASSAFSGCDFISTVMIPDSVTNLGSGTFGGSTNLTKIVIGNSVTSIGSLEFVNCYSLTNITVGSSVTNIGSSAFINCYDLKAVYFVGNFPITSTNLFYTDRGISTAVLYYLPGTIGWGKVYGLNSIVLWNPHALGSGPIIENGALQFTVGGSSNIFVVVEAATNLSNPDWQQVQSLTLAAGSANFSDLKWTNYVCRFYRFSSP